MSYVSCRHLSKSYDGKAQVLSDFNLDIDEGEFLILLGPSGCGKSTLLHMLAGLEAINEGELWMQGRLMNYVAPGKRGCSMVFQNYALYPHMTVYHNLAFSLQVRGVERNEIDVRVREAAAMLNLGALLERKPAALSGGQKQRVAIGSAIVRRPSLYLMDEPLSNLDAALRAQMRVELARLHSRLGATMVYVTHDQTEAMTLGSKIVVLNRGHIQQAAAPDILYTQPANKFVAEFIGSPQMNMLECTVIELGLSCRILMGGQRIRLYGRAAAQLQQKACLYQKLWLGVRAENLYLRPHTARHGSDSDTGLTMSVELCERMGAEQYVHGRTEEQVLVFRAPSGACFERGERLCLYPDMEQLCFFDTSEKNIAFGENI